jgi:hypothetical protein
MAKKKQRGSRFLQPDPEILGRYSFLTDFLAVDWGPVSLRDAYGIYALCLFANYSDYVDIAVDALTEGSDDKDVDFCLVDVDQNVAYVGQTYLAEEWERKEAPTNKSDDLLTGLSWLLKREIEEIPVRLRGRARELQDAIASGAIETLHLLYVTNCLESENVQASLRTVAASAKRLISSPLEVHAKELGLAEMQHLYGSLTKQIVVDDRIVFPATAHFTEHGDGWKAVATTISGEQLHQLWSKHQNDLFSANVRGFLNMLSHKRSVNRGILETILQEPAQFWAYNNGITILSKRIDVGDSHIIATGVSIINGAQTTGVIGSAPADAVRGLRIPCRFIECNDKELIVKIILSNNTQNEIKPFDLRSNDPTQKKLRDDFKKYGITYVHRREGAGKLPPGAIQAEIVGPYLAAFHQHFQTATRQRSSIFTDRSVYGSVFPDGIKAEHVYLVQSLADALAAIKLAMKDKVDRGQANDAELAMEELLRHSTAKFFIAGIVGELAQMILDGRSVPARWMWIASPNVVRPDRARLTTAWTLALEALIPLVAQQAGNGSTGYETVRSATRLKEVATKVSFTMQAIKNQLNPGLSPLRELSEVRS